MRALLFWALIVKIAAENAITLLDVSDAKTFTADWQVRSHEWRVFRTPDDHVISELATTIERIVPLTTTLGGPVMAHYVQARAIAGPAFEAIDVTPCLPSESEPDVCFQHWYFRSKDKVPASGQISEGKISVLVETNASPDKLFKLHFEYHVEFDAQPPAAQSLLTVDNRPYIRVAAENNGSLPEGQEICVTMRNFLPIQPLRAVLCSSSYGDLEPEHGCRKADNVVTLMDSEREIVGDNFVGLKVLKSDPNSIQLCYTDQKLGPFNQLVKIIYSIAGSKKLARREEPEIENRRRHRHHREEDEDDEDEEEEEEHGEFIHAWTTRCGEGREWHDRDGECGEGGRRLWGWVAFIVIIFLVCIVGCWCVYSGYDWYGSEPSKHHRRHHKRSHIVPGKGYPNYDGWERQMGSSGYTGTGATLEDVLRGK